VEQTAVRNFVQMEQNIVSYGGFVPKEAFFGEKEKAEGIKFEDI
jgi:hypothetical protein